MMLRRLSRLSYSRHEGNPVWKSLELESFGKHITLPTPPRKRPQPR